MPENDEINAAQKAFLFEAISLINDSEEARDFLREILTEVEIGHAARRWCAISQMLLDSEKTQEMVRIECNTSKATVTRAKKRVVENGAGASKTILERMKNLDDEC